MNEEPISKPGRLLGDSNSRHSAPRAAADLVVLKQRTCRERLHERTASSLVAKGAEYLRLVGVELSQPQDAEGRLNAAITLYGCQQAIDNTSALYLPSPGC